MKRSGKITNKMAQLKSANEILQKIQSGDLDDKEYWLRLDKEVDEYLKTAPKKETDILSKNWEIMEQFNFNVLRYKKSLNGV